VGTCQCKGRGDWDSTLKSRELSVYFKNIRTENLG